MVRVETAWPVHIVAVLYYRNYFDNLLASLRKLSERHRIEQIVVVVNNPTLDPGSLHASLDGLASRTGCLAHDNTGGEFGAYQLGVDRLREDMQAGTCLIILNETLGIHYPFEREHARAFMRALLDRRYTRRVVGHIDHATRRLGIDGCWSSRWLRSNLVGFDYDALSSIDFRLHAPHLHDYVRETDVVADFFSEKVDRALQDYIADWLFSEGRWYGAAALAKANARALAFKARSILQEKYLAIRLDQRQVAFLPPRYTPAEQVTRRAKNGLRRISRLIGVARPPERS